MVEVYNAVDVFRPRPKLIQVWVASEGFWYGLSDEGKIYYLKGVKDHFEWVLYDEGILSIESDE